jgi:Domain of unknown function (DUF4166)
VQSMSYALRQIHVTNRTPDFERLAGQDGWANLHPAIRRRFSNHDLRVSYPGELSVQASLFGLVFAWLLLPFGNPLPLTRTCIFNAEVNVFPDKDGGVVWQRNFLRPNNSPLRIESVKQLGINGNLMECVRPGLFGGIGMNLKVCERNGALNFISQNYFMRWGKLHLPVPVWLTPGHTLVEHIDEADGKFRFRLTMTHPWFGQTIYQDGVFHDPYSKCS